MKYPHAYSGVKKLFISEILNIISAGLMFVAVLMVLLDGKIKLPDIDTAQFWGLATLVLLSSAVGIAAFVIQFIGLNQARKDEWYFNKALYFVVICAVCTVGMTLTAGTVNSIFAAIDEVFTLLINIYAILAIFTLAEYLKDLHIQRTGKVMIVVITVLFGIALIFQIAAGFVPRRAELLGAVKAGFEFVGYIVCMVYFGMAKKMLGKS